MSLNSWIDLSIGSVDYPIDPLIKRHAAAKLLGSWPGYGDRYGLTELRQHIARWINTRLQTHFTSDNVLITAGASMGLQTLYQCYRPKLVLIPNPGFPLYRQALDRLGIDWTYYRVDDWNACEADIVADLAQADAIIVNSPGNPIGHVVPPYLIEKVTAICASRHLLMISDEVYCEFIWNTSREFLKALPPFFAFFNANPNRSVYVGSFSKMFGLSAFRVGFIIHNDLKQLEHLAATYWQIGMSVNWLGPHVAALCMSNDDSRPVTIRNMIRTNYDHAQTLFEKFHVPYIPVQSGIFVCVDISSMELSSDVVAARLAESEHVLVSPGTQFGNGGQSLVRLNLAVPQEILQDGLIRFGKFFEKGSASVCAR